MKYQQAYLHMHYWNPRKERENEKKKKKGKIMAKNATIDERHESSNLTNSINSK